jgi:hypothetical protein
VIIAALFCAIAYARPNANNLAFIEYDLALINLDYGPKLVIEEPLPAVFDVFRKSDPVADCQRDLLSLEHTECSESNNRPFSFIAFRTAPAIDRHSPCVGAMIKEDL